MTLNEESIIIEGKQYFNKDILKTSNLNNLYTNLIQKYIQSPKELAIQLDDSVEKIKQVIKINPNTNKQVKLNIKDITIDGIKLEISEIESICIEELSSRLNLDAKVILPYFKRFIGSQYFQQEWINFLFYPERFVEQIGIKLDLLVFENVVNAFINYFYEHKLIAYNILTEMSRINLDNKHSLFSIVSTSFNKLISGEQGISFLNTLLDKLHTLKFNKNVDLNSRQLILQQTINEIQVILEFFFITFHSMDFKDYISKFHKWYFNGPISNYLLDLEEEDIEGINNVKLIAFSIFVKLLELNNLDFMYEQPIEQQDWKLNWDNVLANLKSIVNNSYNLSYTPTNLALSIFAFGLNDQLSTYDTYSYDKINDVINNLEKLIKLIAQSNNFEDNKYGQQDNIYNFEKANQQLIWKQLNSILNSLLLNYQYRDALLFKQSLKLFILYLAPTHPNLVSKNIEKYSKVISLLFYKQVELSDQFWEQDFGITSRKVFLDMARSYFPAISTPLFNILASLSGPSGLSSNAVIQLFSNLNSFAQILDQSVLDNIISTEANQYIAIEAKQDVCYIKFNNNNDNKIFLKENLRNVILDDIINNMNIPKGTRAFLDGKQLALDDIILWSYSFDGWKYIFEFINLYINNANFIDVIQQYQEEIVNILEFILYIVDACPTNVIEIQNRYLNGSNVLLNFIFKLIENSMYSQQFESQLFSLSLRMLTKLISIYPNQIVTFLIDNVNLFLILDNSNNYNQFNIFTYLNHHGAQSTTLDVTRVYLDFLIEFVDYFITKLVYNQNTNNKLNSNVIQFISIALNNILSYVYPCYHINRYSNSTYLYLVDLKCVKLFKTILLIEDKLLDTMYQPLLNVIVDHFYTQQNNTVLISILTFIKNYISNLDAFENNEHCSFLVDNLLLESLDVFYMLLKLKEFNSSLDVESVLLSLFSNDSSFNQLVSILLEMIIINSNLKLMEAIMRSLTILLKVAVDYNSEFDIVLNFNVEKLLKRMIILLNSTKVNIQLKDCILGFVSILSISQPNLFLKLLVGDNKAKINNNNVQAKQYSLISYIKQVDKLSYMHFKMFNFIWKYRMKLDLYIDQLIQHTQIWKLINKYVDEYRIEDLLNKSIVNFIFDIMNYEVQYIYEKKVHNVDKEFILLINKLISFSHFEEVLKFNLTLIEQSNSLYLLKGLFNMIEMDIRILDQFNYNSWNKGLDYKFKLGKKFCYDIIKLKKYLEFNNINKKCVKYIVDNTEKLNLQLSDTCVKQNVLIGFNKLMNLVVANDSTTFLNQMDKKDTIIKTLNIVIKVINDSAQSKFNLIGYTNLSNFINNSLLTLSKFNEVDIKLIYTSLKMCLICLDRKNQIKIETNDEKQLVNYFGYNLFQSISICIPMMKYYKQDYFIDNEFNNIIVPLLNRTIKLLVEDLVGVLNDNNDHLAYGLIECLYNVISISSHVISINNDTFDQQFDIINNPNTNEQINKIFKDINNMQQHSNKLILEFNIVPNPKVIDVVLSFEINRMLPMLFNKFYSNFDEMDPKLSKYTLQMLNLIFGLTHFIQDFNCFIQNDFIDKVGKSKLFNSGSIQQAQQNSNNYNGVIISTCLRIFIELYNYQLINDFIFSQILNSCKVNLIKIYNINELDFTKMNSSMFYTIYLIVKAYSELLINCNQVKEFNLIQEYHFMIKVFTNWISWFINDEIENSNENVNEVKIIKKYDLTFNGVKKEFKQYVFFMSISQLLILFLKRASNWKFISNDIIQPSFNGIIVSAIHNNNHISFGSFTELIQHTSKVIQKVISSQLETINISKYQNSNVENWKSLVLNLSIIKNIYYQNFIVAVANQLLNNFTLLFLLDNQFDFDTKRGLANDVKVDIKMAKDNLDMIKQLQNNKYSKELGDVAKFISRSNDTLECILHLVYQVAYKF